MPCVVQCLHTLLHFIKHFHAPGSQVVRSARWALWSPFTEEKTEAGMKLDQGQRDVEDTKLALQPEFLSPNTGTFPTNILSDVT